MHYTMVLILSTVGTIATSLYFDFHIARPIGKQLMARHQLQLREAVIPNNAFCNMLGRHLYCDLCESIY